MDNQRLFLFIALCFVGLLIFQAWQQDYGTGQPDVSQPSTSKPAPGRAGEVPSATGSTTATDTQPATPDVPAAPSAPKAEPAPQAPASDAGPQLPSGQRVQVRTDVLEITLDTVGGDVREVKLRNYATSQDNPEPYQLMSDAPGQVYVAQSGFSMVDGQGPTHTSVYQSEDRQYVLADGQDTLQVPLTWTSDSGVTVTKIYTFRRGRYEVELTHRIANQSDNTWKGSVYHQLKRSQPSDDDSPRFIYTYTGGVIYTPAEHYEKIDFSDIRDEDLDRRNVEDGWIAMIQHYFLSAWIPPEDTTSTFYSRYLTDKGYYNLGMIAPAQSVAPGEQAEVSATIFSGPKLQDHLEDLAQGLELTVDYGILTFLSKPLFWLLDLFHSILGNWGWAIILLTLLIKVVFYKLSETSYRSMAKMRAVQPRMKALKERFGDDRQKMNQALMDLYKEEKINPLGGCLPILIQIPVFIALYWVLLESVEMRQAPWILWINDLSSKDPYFVLPLLMGVTMFLQQKLNPAPMDPLQQKIMMTLPVVFTVFFAFFPAGLVLYWVVNNALSILQQWIITKRVEAGEAT